MVPSLIYFGELLIFQSPLSRSSLKTKTTESDRYAKTIFGTIGGGLHYRGSLPFYSLTKIEKKMKRYYFRIYQGSDFDDGDTVLTSGDEGLTLKGITIGILKISNGRYCVDGAFKKDYDNLAII